MNFKQPMTVKWGKWIVLAILIFGAAFQLSCSKLFKAIDDDKKDDIKPAQSVTDKQTIYGVVKDKQNKIAVGTDVYLYKLNSENTVSANSIVGDTFYSNAADSGYTRTVKTDANGYFYFRNVLTGAYNVEAKKSDTEKIVYKNIQVIKDEPAKFLGILKLEETGLISGEIALSDSTDLLGIQAYIPGTSLGANTDSQGRYTILYVPKGQYEVVCDKPGYQKQILKDIYVNPQENSIAPTVTLKKAETLGKITGLVKLQGQDDHSDILIKLNNTAYSTKTNEMGEFDLDIPIGNYARGITYEKAGYRQLIIPDTVTVMALGAYRIPEQILTAASNTITGNVQILAQQDYSNVRVQLINGEKVYQTKTTENGDFSIPNIAIGEYALTASYDYAPDVNRANIFVKAGEVTAVSGLIVTPQGTIKGKVFLKNQSDQEDIVVALKGTDYSTKTNADGDYQLSNVDVGAYELVASKTDYVTQHLSTVQVFKGDITRPQSLTLVTGEQTFYNWTSSPVQLTEQSEGPVRIAVDIADAANTPQITYTIDELDTGYFQYYDMVNQDQNRWYFDISGYSWSTLVNYTLSYAVKVTDSNGGVVKSDRYQIKVNPKTSITDISVQFESDQLESIIRDEINKPEGNIYPTDLTKITTLKVEQPSAISDLSGLEYCVNLKELTLSTQNITNIEALSTLTNCEKLILNGNRISDISVLESLTALNTLNLNNNDISEVTPLRTLTNLESLELSNNSIQDIAPLSSLTQLESLYLTNNNIRSLNPLSGMTALTKLYVGGNKIQSLSGIDSLTNIQYLDMDNNNVSNIESLSLFSDLIMLSMAGNQVNNIDSLSDNQSIRYLYVQDNQISDIQPLQSMNLQEVDFSGNNANLSTDQENIAAFLKLMQGFITIASEQQSNQSNIIIKDSNLEAIIRQKINKTDGILTYLDLQGITELDAKNAQIVDLQGLSYCTALEVLDLSGNEIKDISELSQLQFLEELQLQNNQLTSISALGFCTRLRRLFLYNNHIEIVSVLSLLNKLEHLDLDNNEIIDISSVTSLSNLRYLNLSNNGISYISYLSSLENLETLLMNNNSISDTYVLEHLIRLTRLELEGNIISNLDQDIGDMNLTKLNVQKNNMIISKEASNNNESVISKLLAAGCEVLYEDGNTIEDEIKLTEDEQAVFFADSNLEQSLRWSIGKYTGPIYVTDLFEVRYLTVTYKNISDLSGLEHCVNLTYLDLSNNNISSINVLENCTKLTTLKLRNNNITDISSIATLTSLSSLYLNDNQISDIDELSALTGLYYLYLGNNQISNIDVISSMTSLYKLELQGNQVIDIEPMRELRLWGGVNIENNNMDLTPGSDNLSVIRDLKYNGNSITYIEGNNLTPSDN